MAEIRHQRTATELERYFGTVIDWVDAVFIRSPDKEMRGLEWGRLYEIYHREPYDPQALDERVSYLRDNVYVTDKRGIYEFVLGGERQLHLLNIRFFQEDVKQQAYTNQTEVAKSKGASNCPLCANGHPANAKRIWAKGEMEADHVTAWSRGGGTSLENCQMLCKTHNRAKGNR